MISLLHFIIIIIASQMYNYDCMIVIQELEKENHDSLMRFNLFRV